MLAECWEKLLMVERNFEVFGSQRILIYACTMLFVSVVVWLSKVLPNDLYPLSFIDTLPSEAISMR